MIVDLPIVYLNGTPRTREVNVRFCTVLDPKPTLHT